VGCWDGVADSKFSRNSIWNNGRVNSGTSSCNHKCL